MKRERETRKPTWQQEWERLLIAARNGDKAAHDSLGAYPTLPTGTAYRAFDVRTCSLCGGIHAK